MLGSISPVGESSRGQRWWLTAAAYVIASTASGALVGALFGMLGWPLAQAVPTAARAIALGAVMAVAATWDAGLIKWPLPTWHRQVDERWLDTYRGWVYGAGFGAQLGAGLATIVTSAVTYAALAAALLSGSWRAGLAIGTTFGFVRSVPLLLTARVRSVDRLWRATQRVAHAEPLVDRLTVAAQAVAAVTILALTAAR